MFGQYLIGFYDPIVSSQFNDLIHCLLIDWSPSEKQTGWFKVKNTSSDVTQRSLQSGGCLQPQKLCRISINSHNITRPWSSSSSPSRAASGPETVWWGKTSWFQPSRDSLISPRETDWPDYWLVNRSASPVLVLNVYLNLLCSKTKYLFDHLYTIVYFRETTLLKQNQIRLQGHSESILQFAKTSTCKVINSNSIQIKTDFPSALWVWLQSADLRKPVSAQKRLLVWRVSLLVLVSSEHWSPTCGRHPPSGHVRCFDSRRTVCDVIIDPSGEHDDQLKLFQYKTRSTDWCFEQLLLPCDWLVWGVSFRSWKQISVNVISLQSLNERFVWLHGFQRWRLLPSTLGEADFHAGQSWTVVTLWRGGSWLPRAALSGSHDESDLFSFCPQIWWRRHVQSWGEFNQQHLGPVPLSQLNLVQAQLPWRLLLGLGPGPEQDDCQVKPQLLPHYLIY